MQAMTISKEQFKEQTKNNKRGDTMILQTLFEIVLFIFILWSIFNEDKYIKLERKIRRLFKK